MSQTKNSLLILGDGFASLFTALGLSYQLCSLPIVAVERVEFLNLYSREKTRSDYLPTVLLIDCPNTCD